MYLRFLLLTRSLFAFSRTLTIYMYYIVYATFSLHICEICRIYKLQRDFDTVVKTQAYSCDYLTEKMSDCRHHKWVANIVETCLLNHGTIYVHSINDYRQR